MIFNIINSIDIGKTINCFMTINCNEGYVDYSHKQICISLKNQVIHIPYEKIKFDSSDNYLVVPTQKWIDEFIKSDSLDTMWLSSSY